MERQVIFRDRQELQALDLNNIELFADETLRHLVVDAVTGERMFVGLAVSQKSATELDIAAGRLWDGAAGKLYRKDQPETISVFSHLPVSDSKWLVLSVIGQEIETDSQPRDFLIDLQSGQTEPRVVAMELSRTIAVLVTPGLESASPQQPEAPTGYTVIAHVLLGASGIVETRIADNKRLMRLFEVWQGMLANTRWIAEAAPKLASIMSDLANLAALIRGMSTGMISKLAAEVALIRDRLQLPATFNEYEADNFLTQAESDVANPEYYALVRMGIRFPWAGETEQQLDLFNPYDDKVRNFVGFILPAHGLVARLSTTGLAGELLLNQYQYQTVQHRLLTRTRVRTVYSPTFRYCTNGAQWGGEGDQTIVEEVFEGEIPAGVTLGESTWRENIGSQFTDEGSGHTHGYARNVWRHAWTEDYWVVDSVTNSINGSVNAQTFLNSQNGWLRKVGLHFSRQGTDGAVTMLLTNTINGLPNMERVLGSAVVQPGDITITPEETVFEFAQPIFLSPGLRYAIVLITGGAHSVALVEGTQYSHGTLFYSTDGEYFQGDFTKDLMMTMYYASFQNPRTIVDLEPVSLANGIAAFDILHELIQPEATSLVLEYQPSGTGEWAPIQEGTTDRLLGLPAMCRLRAVFNGSQDIMPGLGLTGSKLRAQRPGATFRHISTSRVLSQASANIDVILRLEGWDPAKHSCVVKLLSGGNTYNGTAVDEDLGNDTIRRTVTFAPNTPAGISSYKIQIEGTTTTALTCFHVAQRMDVAK